MYLQLSVLTSPIEEDPMATDVFSALQALTAAFMSFVHGSNDTA